MSLRGQPERPKTMATIYGSVFVALLATSYIRPARGQCVSGTWSGPSNLQSFGAYNDASLNNIGVSNCMSRCQAQQTCVGIDMNGQNCWLSQDTNSLASNNYGIIHYNYTRSCASYTSPLTTGCYWNASVNSNSPSGALQSSVYTLADCFSKCSVTSTCLTYGMDWDSTYNKCYFSTLSIVNYGSFPGVTHYNWACPQQTTPSVGCTWNISQSSYSPGGQYMSQDTTLTLCQNDCYADSNCMGFDWNIANSLCYKSAAGGLIGYNQAPGVTHYQKLCASAGKNAPTILGIVTLSLFVFAVLQKLDVCA